MVCTIVSIIGNKNTLFFVETTIIIDVTKKEHTDIINDNEGNGF